MIAFGIICGSLLMLGIIGAWASIHHGNKMVADTRLTLAEETDYEIRHPQGRRHG